MTGNFIENKTLTKNGMRQSIFLLNVFTVISQLINIPGGKARKLRRIFFFGKSSISKKVNFLA